MNQTQLYNRTNQLIDTYLTIDHLNDRLADLPHQFHNPTTRPWGPINWAEIGPDQVIGLDASVFANILKGTINTEAPIRGYTQASRQYLEHDYPQMARFVGGRVSATGEIIELGLWEKEERQHTPALLKVYQQLTGQTFTLQPHQARPYSPSDDPRQDLYRHGLHRIATEYGAACLYLWMMTHTTGQLQAVLAELLIDEVNHMSKFWGYGAWAYPESSFFKIGKTLFTAMRAKWQDPQIQGSLLHTLRRMTQELYWAEWSFTNQANLIYTFGRVLERLLQWHRSLTPDYLRELLGEHSLNCKETTRQLQTAMNSL